jgi:hypothetical protein
MMQAEEVLRTRKNGTRHPRISGLGRLRCKRRVNFVNARVYYAPRKRVNTPAEFE